MPNLPLFEKNSNSAPPRINKHSKISQLIKMQLISPLSLKLRKLFRSTKTKMVDDIFISKLLTTENNRESDLSENNELVDQFQQNELYECNVMLVKVYWMKTISKSNMLKGKCKTKDLKFVFRSIVLNLTFKELLLVAFFTIFNRY